MITVTPDAARQIRVAAAQAEATDLALRIAARRDPDGSLHYAMGFDAVRDTDLEVESEGVIVLVDPGHRALLAGLTLDYVEYEQGDFRFIFINPNDRPAVPAAPGAATGAGCGAGCGCKGS